MNKIFVTGGAGYVGAVMVPHLLEQGYVVTVLDLMIYGEHVLPKHNDLNAVRGDIRNQDLLKKLIPGHDAVIHLACISNDPSFEMNPNLGKSINLDAFRPLVDISKKANVKRFFYASSSSVYGIKEEPNVHEEMELEPLTDYSILRAPKEKIAGKIYNAGYENQSVKKIAETVKNVVGDDVKLITSHSDDNRSYHISSKKIQNELGFVAKHTIRDAVIDLCDAFDQNLLPNSLDDEMYFNIKRMQNLELV